MNETPVDLRVDLWEGYHESRRRSRDTFPESYTLAYEDKNQNRAVHVGRWTWAFPEMFCDETVPDSPFSSSHVA